MIKEYLLQIIVAAIICSLINVLLSKTSAVGATVKLLSRIFLTITILTPFLNMDFSHIFDSTNDISLEANAIIDEGEALSLSTLQNSIKSETEAYILNKASAMNVELTVEVTVSEDYPPVPISVKLDGRVSPNAKSKLTQLISDELGISKENQKWK